MRRKEEERQASLRRRGRASTIIAPQESQLGAAPVTRPTATSLG